MQSEENNKQWSNATRPGAKWSNRYVPRVDYFPKTANDLAFIHLELHLRFVPVTTYSPLRNLLSSERSEVSLYRMLVNETF